MLRVSDVEAAAIATITKILNIALPTMVPTPTELDVLNVSAKDVKNSGAEDPAADAAAQRHRGVEHHEKDGLAAMPPTRPLTCRKAPYAVIELVSSMPSYSASMQLK